MAHLSLSDQSVGGSSVRIGCRSKKQRQVLPESVYVRFCAAEELSSCQRLEVAAEIVAIDITHCSYSFDLQKRDGCWHGEIVLPELTAGMGNSLSPFRAPCVSQPMV